ncbi:MAG TPA: glycosyltransferase family 39 protein [Gemmataceae bacterium]|nr:glycosyltransferase family 39 protein [Gemmataceae bacterium]
MFRFCHHRAAHYLLLLVSAAALTLPNLGRHSLWDVDEGMNAETAREMLESGDYVVLRFNYIYRDSKPALLFWLQAGAYHLFGVNEFAARLPCAMAAILNVLLIYELGRAMFSPAAGLLAGFVQITALLAGITSQLAIPDALLQLFTTLTFLCFWKAYTCRLMQNLPSRRWYVALGISCGLAILAKGPIGLALPGLILIAFLLWQREAHLFWTRRTLLVLLACWLTAAPWFILETIQTHGWFAKGFFITNNVHRFFRPMEDHRGPWYYHLVAILFGFAPWSVFFGPMFWQSRPSFLPKQAILPKWQSESAVRLLWCWIAAYFMFFSVAATKLPNYLLPLYPALALMTGQFLESWRQRQAGRRAAIVFCTGILVCASLAIAATMRFSSSFGMHLADDGLIKQWAWVALVPACGAIVAIVFVLWQRRTEAVVTLAATALAFVGAVIAVIVPGLESWRAPRQLVARAGALRRQEEVRLASYHYTRPSLAFYSQREVHQLDTEDEVQAFLRHPLPVYLFIAEPDWEPIRKEEKVSGIVVARAWDIHKNCCTLVVSNRQPAGQTSSRLVSSAE